MALWECVIERDALVLGSRQALSASASSAANAAGIEVAQRRSGGGAVYLSAQTSLWIDLWFPTVIGQRSIDLTALFVGVGEAWASGLSTLGFDVTVHKGPGSARPERRALAQRVCFADVGWGEVMVGDVKVVGLSQRRVRAGVRVQCVAELTGAGAAVMEYVEANAYEREVIAGFTKAVSHSSARSSSSTIIEYLLGL